MKLGRVIGNLEGSVKHPCYRNLKMMVVQPLDASLQPQGRTHPAVDTVGAGAGNLVLVVEEGKAAQALTGQKKIPIRTLIVGIVDDAVVAGGTKEELV